MAKVNSRDIYHKKYVLVYWYTRDHYDNSLSFYICISLQHIGVCNGWVSLLTAHSASC